MDHLEDSTPSTPTSNIDELLGSFDPVAILEDLSPGERDEKYNLDGLLKDAVEIVETYGDTNAKGDRSFSAGGSYSIDLALHHDSTDSLTVTRNDEVILLAQRSDDEWSITSSEANLVDAAHFSVASFALSFAPRDFVSEPNKQPKEAEKLAAQFLHDSGLQSLFKESCSLTPRSMRIDEQPPVRVYFFNDEPRVHFFETNNEGSEVLRSADFDISKDGELSLRSGDSGNIVTDFFHRNTATSFLRDINKQGYAEILKTNFVEPRIEEKERDKAINNTQETTESSAGFELE